VIFDGHIEQCPTKYTKETIIAAIGCFENIEKSPYFV
jgi:hypothetical protein